MINHFTDVREMVCNTNGREVDMRIITMLALCGFIAVITYVWLISTNQGPVICAAGFLFDVSACNRVFKALIG